jgi:hypothetical protein
MGGLTDKPKVVQPPPVPPAPPPPTTETAVQAAEQVKKRGPTARQATFLTGDLIPEDTRKKKVLG